MKVFLSAALLLSSMTLGAAGPAGADGVWRDPVDISPAARDGSSPQITSSADGKRLTSVWISNDGVQDRATVSVAMRKSPLVARSRSPLVAR